MTTNDYETLRTLAQDVVTAWRHPDGNIRPPLNALRDHLATTLPAAGAAKPSVDTDWCECGRHSTSHDGGDCPVGAGSVGIFTPRRLPLPAPEPARPARRDCVRCHISFFDDGCTMCPACDAATCHRSNMDPARVLAYRLEEQRKLATTEPEMTEVNSLRTTGLELLRKIEGLEEDNEAIQRENTIMRNALEAIRFHCGDSAPDVAEVTRRALAGLPPLFARSTAPAPAKVEGASDETMPQSTCLRCGRPMMDCPGLDVCSGCMAQPAKAEGAERAHNCGHLGYAMDTCEHGVACHHCVEACRNGILDSARLEVREAQLRAERAEMESEDVRRRRMAGTALRKLEDMITERDDLAAENATLRQRLAEAEREHREALANEERGVTNSQRFADRAIRERDALRAKLDDAELRIADMQAVVTHCVDAENEVRAKLAETVAAANALHAAEHEAHAATRAKLAEVEAERDEARKDAAGYKLMYDGSLDKSFQTLIDGTATIDSLRREVDAVTAQAGEAMARMEALEAKLVEVERERDRNAHHAQRAENVGHEAQRERDATQVENAKLSRISRQLISERNQALGDSEADKAERDAALAEVARLREALERIDEYINSGGIVVNHLRSMVCATLAGGKEDA